MPTDPIVRVSKKMSWLLRHGANEAGVALDSAGWARIDDVLRVLQVHREVLDSVVAQNDKQRFEMDGERIRAVQGHSVLEVSPEQLEASWVVFASDQCVWHGTQLLALDSIAVQGLKAQGRSHVHLAPAADSRVGKRAGTDVLLQVSTVALRECGFQIWQAPNGVVLARAVPAACIVGVVPLTRAARGRTAELVARWPLVELSE